jgi:hypothetical protein
MNVLLNPAFPKREGTNVHGDKDVNGKLFHDEFMNVIHSRGSGWVDYMFPKPGQTKPSQKMELREGGQDRWKSGADRCGFLSRVTLFGLFFANRRMGPV